MFETFKQQWAPAICSWVPLNAWHRLVDIELVLPYYHVVGDEELAHVSELYSFRNVEQFKADMEFFLCHYTPVGLQDVINHLDGTSRLPKRCFLLTFDDGFREIHDVIAPILRARGIPAVFFLMTSVLDNREMNYPQKISLLLHALKRPVNEAARREAAQVLAAAGVNGPDLASSILAVKYRQRQSLDTLAPVLGCDFNAYAATVQPHLTSEQVRNLIRMGFTIGAHSIDHPRYPELSLDEQLRQTRTSLDRLTADFQCDCKSFAFPFAAAGVPAEFFKAAFADGQLAISFGTGGMLPHFFPKHLERFTMERTDKPAVQILARQLARTFLRRPLGLGHE